MLGTEENPGIMF
jgi:kinesin family protein 18/19